MIKKLTFFFTILYFFNLNFLLAHNTSTYLITNIAFISNDFETVFDQFDISNQSTSYDYQKELMSLVILDKMDMANEVSLEMLKISPDNQEAKMINFSYSLINNENKKNFFYEFNNNEDENDFFNYIFFRNNQLKEFKEISNSFADIVESNFSEFSSAENFNYNYLLFYLSLSTLFDQKNDRAWFLTAQIYQIIKQYNKAIYYYKKIHPNSTYFSDAKLYIAYNYGELLPFSKAEEEIKKLINLSKNDSALLKILADFYRRNNQYDLAIKYYTKLVQRKEDNLWHLLYLRGICFERSNKWSLAEVDFLSSIEINPDSPDVLNYLAYGWIEKNINLDLSLTMLKKAYEQDPDNHYILDSLAWAHYKKNNLKIALQLMEKVIDMSPGEAISLDHLGDIYFSLNRKREASFLWRQAKDLAEPEDNITEKIINKLEKYYEG